MDESKFEKLLSIPGVKRAAQGVILPIENGGFFHILNVYDSKVVDGLTQDEHLFLAFCSKNEILRLREIRGAHDYLLRLRAHALVDSPRAVRVMTARKKLFESSGRQWSLTYYYHSKDAYHKSYLVNLKKAQAKALKNTPTGLAFVSQANALCIRSFSGDVIVVSESLEYFYYFMTIAFYGPKLGIKPIDQADALLIAIRIMTGAEALDFDIDPRGNLGHELERKLKAIVKSQMKFTFGHEYAHLLCGHLTSPYVPGEVISHEKGAGLLKDLRTYSYDLEHQADYFALKNIEHDHDAYQNVAQGGFSALLYLHFIQEVSELYDLKIFSASDTHPKPKDRIIKLHINLGKKSPLDEEALDNNFIISAKLAEILRYRLQFSTRDDLFSFYGSVYLSSYASKTKVDRYAF